MKTSNPADYLVHVFGGVRPAARALKLTPAALCKWKRNSRIPSSNFSNILQVAKDLNLDLNPEDLVIGREFEERF